MDGAALNGTGSNKGHLDNHVFDLRDLDAQQYLDLSSDLDLDNAQDIATLDHLVDFLVLEVDILGPDDPAVALADVAQATLQLVQAGVAQKVQLDKAGFIHGVFVPLADEAVRHSALLNGHLLIHAIGRNDDAA